MTFRPVNYAVLDQNTLKYECSSIMRNSVTEYVYESNIAEIM